MNEKRLNAGMPKKNGRPSKYSAELVAEICDRLSTGEPLTKICSDEHMPNESTVWRWMEAGAQVSQDIARARDRGFDAIAQRARETARGSGDSSFDVQRDKLIVETDLKLLAKWCPKRYGEKVEVEHSGTVRAVIGGADA